MPEHKGSALFSDYRLIEPVMALRMLKHRQTEVEQVLLAAHFRAGRLPTLLMLRQGLTELFETAKEQLLLVHEVRVEGGPPDVRPVNYVLHRDFLVPFLNDEFDQRIS